MIYDKFNKKPSEEITEKKFNEDTDKVIQKLRKHKSLKPRIIKDELDKNFIRANSLKSEDEDDIIKLKNSFICPIGQIMMDNPVITPYGTTYEQSEILKWIEKNNNDYITKKPLCKDMLVPNHMLKATMKEYTESLKK